MMIDVLFSIGMGAVLYLLCGAILVKLRVAPHSLVGMLFWPVYFAIESVIVACVVLAGFLKRW